MANTRPLFYEASPDPATPVDCYSQGAPSGLYLLLPLSYSSVAFLFERSAPTQSLLIFSTFRSGLLCMQVGLFRLGQLLALHVRKAPSAPAAHVSGLRYGPATETAWAAAAVDQTGQQQEPDIEGVFGVPRGQLV